MLNERLAESVIVRISRGTRMKLKVLAALQAKTQEEYLETLINTKENERLLGVSKDTVSYRKRERVSKK